MSLDQGERVEIEVRTDFNDDGAQDLAYIASSEDNRELRVVVSYADEFDIGEHPPQVLALDSFPLGDARVSVERGVLSVIDASAGTTSIQSTHRFRWDKKLDAMRLIGLDATLYSRTFAHDGQVASWNLLTGEFTSYRLKLRNDGSDIAYDEVDRIRRRKRSAPLRLEQSPSGDELLGWPLSEPGNRK